MKRLPTEFDSNRLSQTVATPTCSSCCCCCCCLATTISASSLLGQRINQEAKQKHIPNATALTFAAYLFVPIVLAISYAIYSLLTPILSKCSIEYYDGYSGSQSYQSCSNGATALVLPVIIATILLVLWFLYSRIHFEHPWKRSFLVASVFAVAFVAEFFGGAALILTGVGGIVYLVLVPVIIGWITIWYAKHLKNKN